VRITPSRPDRLTRVVRCRRGLSRLLLSFCGVVLGCVLPLHAQRPPARVALVLDEQSPRYQPLVSAFEQELRSFFRPGELELLPAQAGDGTSAGVEAVIDRAMADSTVSVVITVGGIGSHLLASMGPPAKPSIAAVVIDAVWQGLPQRDGSSGVRGLAYVDQSFPVANTLADFRRLIPFRKLALLLDRHLLEGIPQLRASAAAMVREVGSDAVVIPVSTRAEEALAQLPADVDAVYLTPLPVLPDAELQELIDGLNRRRLPVLSFSVDPEIRLGALASYEPPENWQRRTRRIAVDLQRILAGEDAGTLPVHLVSAPRLTLNLATARKIGYAPGWSVMTEAVLAGVDSAGPTDTLALAEAMRQAVETNLDLAAADLDVESGHQDVLLARSNLLPQIESQVTQTYTRSETAEASLGQQPQRKLDGGLSFSVPLYADQAWAGYGSQRSLQEGRESGRDALRLDIVLQTAGAYLNVLRAGTLVEIQRSNLYRSRSNLEIARLRESVGSASRADIYRWQGEVATARRDLIDAESQVRIAGLELKRLLNRPLDRPLAPRPVSLADAALLPDDSAFRWLEEPPRFARLERFLVEEALRRSPEVLEVDAAIAAQRRQRASAGRAFWLPTFALQGGLTNEFSRGGAGASAQPLPQPFTGLFSQPEDLTWQFRLQATLPLFTGLERTATRAKASIDLDRLEVQREGVRQAIDQRVRTTLETAASSYAAITLTRDAAEAAGRNYDLVSDAYASGTASITTLLDAQSAALSSSQSAANAIHDFLFDLLEVERAMGAFAAVESPARRAEFLERFRAFMRETP
jgi:outer membrane protein